MSDPDLEDVTEAVDDVVDDYPAEDEPDGAVEAPHHFYIGVFVAAFGFVSVWPFYPSTGATMTLIGTAILVDDVLSHAFGIPTPLDWIWERFIHPRLG